MSGICKDCRHYEPFEVYWETEKLGWTDEDTPEAERAGLAEFDEVARFQSHEQWKTRRWGRCLLAEANSGSLKREESKSAAIDFESYGAELRCAPDFGCVQWREP